MSTPYTPANVAALKSNPAWGHIVACLKAELDKAEAVLENEGEFNHGKGVGMRQVVRMMLALPEQMEKQAAGGGGMVSRIRRITR